MALMMTKKGQEMLKRHEGLRLSAYKDTVGLKTIGYGHNLVARPEFKGEAIPDKITQEFATELFEHDLSEHEAALIKAVPWILQMEDLNRRDVLINMCFNMGPAFPHKWPRLFMQCEYKLWDAAANNMAGTKWARQVKSRADDLVAIMRTGEY
jgi:lysozyme